ncbi:MAG: DUF885 domain-containing protein [Erysipelotrichaceae bacterium]|nr:DUF885 domain-containing protein [Erysipelotrichaceae bacterium]
MKKTIIILLCILFLAGCTGKKEEPEVKIDGAYYVEQMRNFKPGNKNKGNTEPNKDFTQYLDWLFEEKAVSSFLDFHFNIYDYKALGLEKPEAVLGQYKYGLDEEQIKYYTDVLNDLRAFDYDSLSYEQQYDYDCIEFDTLCQLASLYFYRYNFCMKAGESVLDTVMGYFTDYTFNDEEAVVDYLNCLNDIPRAFDDALTYTKQQADDGYPLLDEWVNYLQETCDSFISAGEKNDLILSFDRRIESCEGLDEKAKEDYKNQNRQIILEQLMPAYKKVKEDVEQYRGKANEDDYRFFVMDKDYADYMYMSKGCSSYSADEMLQIMTDGLSIVEAEYVSSLYEDGSFEKTIAALNGEYEVFTMSHEDTLAYLYEHENEYFPELGEVKYTVEMLDPENAPSTVVAYYWQAPIDNDDINIIRVNPNNDSEITYAPYGTLAHEGFPGHLYQIVYYHKQNPSKIRLLLVNNLAYLEGWAEYASYYGYRMAGLEDDYAASVLFYDTNEYFFEYSIADLLTNYYGYTAEEIRDFFNENSINCYSLEYYEALREIMIEYSGQYFPYGLGTSFMLDLRDQAAQKKGSDFDIVALNKAILDSGIMPLNVLKSSVFERLGIAE